MKKQKKSTKNPENIYKDCLIIFGELKQKAIESGKVNDCSINKIIESSGADSLWIKGTRAVSGRPDLKKKFLQLATDVKTFRKEFKNNSLESDTQKEFREIKEKYNSLKNSVERMRSQYWALIAKTKDTDEVINDNDELSTQLLAKNNELETRLHGVKTCDDTGLSFSTVKQQVVEVDQYRFENGRYAYGDCKQEAKVWANATNKLYELLDRPLVMRLYVLVGLPCSGKTKWANSNNDERFIESDKHPVIYDATNLTAIERASVITPIKKMYPDLPIYCVFFDTDIDKIRTRNLVRDELVEAKFTPEELTHKLKKMMRPDPYIETWIDCLKVVRDL